MDVAPYLTRDEYACRHCGNLPPDLYDSTGAVKEGYQYLFDAWKAGRELVGARYISSGYRCPIHNADIGGVILSVHVFGYALDIEAETAGDVNLLYDVFDEVDPDLRIGKYSWGIHIDIGWLIDPRASEHWIRGKRWKQ